VERRQHRRRRATVGQGLHRELGGGHRRAGIVDLLGPLLNHFGATSRVPGAPTASHGGLHTRHYISNNGLHDVWVLFNESGTAVTTDIALLPDYHPPSCTEMVTGQPLVITRDPAGDKITGIKLAPLETKMLLCPRQDVAAAPLNG